MRTAMPHPTLLVIGGHSGSGKTTLARALATELDLPLLSKDAIKETLFTTLGTSDAAWSRRLGATAIALLFQQVTTLLSVRQSCLIESIFRAEHDGPVLRALCQRYAIQPIELQCTAPGHILVARVQARAANGTRHPGHGDELAPATLERLRTPAPLPLLDLGGPQWLIDTSTADAPTVAEIAQWIRSVRHHPP
jgi:predicted kinase